VGFIILGMNVIWPSFRAVNLILLMYMNLAAVSKDQGGRATAAAVEMRGVKSLRYFFTDIL
jgi:hypothetical protein